LELADRGGGRIERGREVLDLAGVADSRGEPIVDLALSFMCQGAERAEANGGLYQVQAPEKKGK